MAFTVIYDSCVLYPNYLRDLLIRLARTGIVHARTCRWAEGDDTSLCPGRLNVRWHEGAFRKVMDDRMMEYALHLVLKTGKPVVSIAVFLTGGPKGIKVREVRKEAAGWTSFRSSIWPSACPGA